MQQVVALRMVVFRSPSGSYLFCIIDAVSPQYQDSFSIVLYYTVEKPRYNGICLRCSTSSQVRKRGQ